MKKYWARIDKMHMIQPINLIRKYFGEQISIYFAWLGYYTKSLVIPSIFGILVLFFGYLFLDNDIPT